MKQTFDIVEWRRLLHALRWMGIDWRDRRLNRKPVHGAEDASKNRWRVLGTGKGGRSVRQGCPLSPSLFNIYIEEPVREAVEDLEERIMVGGRWRLADDQAMVAKSQIGLQAI